MEFLDGLSGEQRAAVEHTDGAILILAGAGSGKTRVITHRLAYLMATGRAQAFEVLALTFTNKAAREMRERVGTVLDRVGLGHIPVQALWVTTFHSFGVRILRRHADLLGYDPGFVIYDSDDSNKVVKKVFAELEIDDERIIPSGFHSWLDRSGKADFETEADGSFLERTYMRILEAYRARLKAANAMDFRDLLHRPLELFLKFPEVLARFQQQFRYVLVDEYQDTNRIQYRLTRLLAGGHGNVCAVGDEDQSIYSWRGADIQNILDFETDFSGNIRVFHLLENYRSPQLVLDAANSVIVNNVNTHRKEEPLVGRRKGGAPITVHFAVTADQEAAWVCRQMQDLMRNGVRADRIAVFYRTHAHSRLLEQRLIQERVAYQVFGGLPFFARKEVKDLLAYLWVAANPRDPICVERAVMVPKRGFGQTSFDKCAAAADEAGVSLYEGLRTGLGLSATVRRKLDGFFAVIDGIREAAPRSLADAVTGMVDALGYREYLLAEEKEDQSELVDEFVNLITEFERERVPHLEAGGPSPLVAFLEAVSLQASVDTLESESGRITLMTVHNAKGLEFPYVFMIGLEDGIFPHASSFDDTLKMEEERRLFYVGVTRTEERLFFTCSRQRMVRGALAFQLPSRFLAEVEPTCLRMPGGGPVRLPRRPPQLQATIDPIYED